MCWLEVLLSLQVLSFLCLFDFICQAHSGTELVCFGQSRQRSDGYECYSLVSLYLPFYIQYRIHVRTEP